MVFNYLTNRPNTTKARQIAFQNDPLPTYAKGIKRFSFPLAVMCALGSAFYSGSLAVSYVRGTHKVKEH